MKQIRWIILFIVMVCLSGCFMNSDQEEYPEDSYRIYYLNPNGTKLQPYEYKTSTVETEQLVDTLMQMFLKVPDDVDALPALDSKIEFESFRLVDGILNLYFDNNYSGMHSHREILCRAALSKTFTQLPGVEYISIFVGDQPLLDGNQNPVGPISGSEFIESIGDVNSYEKATLTLYFADESGQYLIPETREVVHDINTSLERIVIDELIQGPMIIGLQPVLQSDVKVISVSITDNVCYINFDNSFLNNTLEVGAEIPIYSIVNSISEVSKANKIQISVNGVQDNVFRESVSLNTLFERNLDYIGGENN